MTELRPWPFLLIIFLTACSSKDKATQSNKLLTKFEQISESVQDTFYINLQVPGEYFDNPQKTYPIIVLVDGNFYFPMMASIISQYETAGLLEPSIIVGVGYNPLNTWTPYG